MVVEAALVTPLLFAMILGIATFGVAFSHKLSLNNAVREAARYGATVPSTQCDTTSNCSNMNWAQLVQSLAVSRSDGSLSTSQICVALVSGSGSNPVAIDSTHTTAGGTSPCYVDNSADTGRRVQVTATRNDTIQVVFFSRTSTLLGQATARFEQ